MLEIETRSFSLIFDLHFIQVLCACSYQIHKKKYLKELYFKNHLKVIDHLKVIEDENPLFQKCFKIKS